MIKALEYNGSLFLQDYKHKMVKNDDTGIDTSEAWFIMKHSCAHDTRYKQLASIWNVKKIYGCTFSPDIENELIKLNTNMFVKSCMS